MGGTIDLLFDTPSSALPHVKSGKTVAIAASSDARVTDAPDAHPEGTGLSLADAVRLDRAVRAGRHAAETLARLRGALKQALHTPAVREFILAGGNDILDLYGDDMLAMQKQMQDFWRGVVKSRGIRLD